MNWSNMEELLALSDEDLIQAFSEPPIDAYLEVFNIQIRLKCLAAGMSPEEALKSVRDDLARENDIEAKVCVRVIDLGLVKG